MTDVRTQIDAELARLNGHAGDLFHRYDLADLIAEARRPISWTVRGLLVAPTYGQIAGARKALKSYLATFLAVGVASGQPIWSTFAVDRPGPVLMYVGEGGREPWTRRLIRIADAMNVDLDDLPITPSFDVAPIDSLRFQASLDRDLDELRPRLVIVDPLYAFHGRDTTASNLHDEGALLSSLSSACITADATVLVVNHFNKTGAGNGLDRITMAGSAEWVDTWLLTSHRNPPDVAAGRFQLELDIGSRQWGGSTWHLDLNIGRFEPITGTHDGPIEWELTSTANRPPNDLERIAAIVDEHPLELTKEDIAKRYGGNAKRARELVDRAEHAALIHPRLTTRDNTAGSARKVWLYLPGPHPAATALDDVRTDVHKQTTPDDATTEDQ